MTEQRSPEDSTIPCRISDGRASSEHDFPLTAREESVGRPSDPDMMLGHGDREEIRSAAGKSTPESDEKEPYSCLHRRPGKEPMEEDEVATLASPLSRRSGVSNAVGSENNESNSTGTGTSGEVSGPPPVPENSRRSNFDRSSPEKTAMDSMYWLVEPAPFHGKTDEPDRNLRDEAALAVVALSMGMDPRSSDTLSSSDEDNCGRRHSVPRWFNYNRRGRSWPKLSILKRARRDAVIKKTTVSLRVFSIAFCLISFSSMAADRKRGWTLDSFNRYKEFRYCLSANVLGAAYSSLQLYQISIGAAKIQRSLPFHCLEFSIDQILAYLMISASSSAASRVSNWISNWGADEFPQIATVSVAMSFLSFVTFASISIISGHALSHRFHV